MIRKLVPALGLLVLGAGCGYQHAVVTSPVRVAQYRKVAVLPLENLAGIPEAANVVHELLLEELGEKTPWVIIDPYADGLISADMPAHHWRSLSHEMRLHEVDLMVIGAVTEYSYRRNVARDELKEPVAGISLRLFDVASGEIVWSGVFSRSSNSKLNAQRDPLARVTALTVEDAATAIGEGLE